MALAAVKPVNLEEERVRFMQDEAYQPKFEYKDAAAARAACERQLPSHEYLGLAINVLEHVRERFGSESRYHEAVWGDELTQPQADDVVREYLQRNGLSQLVRVRWSASHLLTSFGSGCLNLVDRQGYYRTKRLLGLLDHELGTHFTRAHNFKFSLCGLAQCTRQAAS